MLDQVTAEPSTNAAIGRDWMNWDDDEAARIVVERFRPRLLREIERRIGAYLARRLDKEDILQSAFCSFFRRAKDGQYQFDHSNALCLLLLTIAENKIRRAAAYHTRLCRDVRREAGVTVAELDLSDRVAEQELACVEDIVERIAEIVDGLPARDAEFFRRRYMENHTIGQISADTNWSVTTVKRVLKETRERVRDRVESGW